MPPSIDTELGWASADSFSQSRSTISADAANIPGEAVAFFAQLSKLKTQRDPKELGGVLALHLTSDPQTHYLKSRMEELFAGGGTWYFSDLADKLDLDLETVVKLSRELMREGKIKVDANAR